MTYIAFIYTESHIMLYEAFWPPVKFLTPKYLKADGGKLQGDKAPMKSFMLYF